MKAKLVSYSKSLDESNSEQNKTIGDMVAYCDRVSNPSNQNNTVSNDKLLAYLIKLKISPIPCSP